VVTSKRALVTTILVGMTNIFVVTEEFERSIPLTESMIPA